MSVEPTTYTSLQNARCSFSVQIARRITVVDDAGPHPDHWIDGKRAELHGPVAEQGVDAAGVAGAEVATPDGRVVVGIRNASGLDGSPVFVGLRREVKANDTLVPACVVPALVVAAVRSIELSRQTLFG